MRIRRERYSGYWRLKIAQYAAASQARAIRFYSSLNFTEAADESRGADDHRLAGLLLQLQYFTATHFAIS
jgi:hypothetical protein